MNSSFQFIGAINASKEARAVYILFLVIFHKFTVVRFCFVVATEKMTAVARTARICQAEGAACLLVRSTKMV
jgi:hypothetical protein